MNRCRWITVGLSAALNVLVIAPIAVAVSGNSSGSGDRPANASRGRPRHAPGRVEAANPECNKIRAQHIACYA
jgi:hypothetical protein